MARLIGVWVSGSWGAPDETLEAISTGRLGPSFKCCLSLSTCVCSSRAISNILAEFKGRGPQRLGRRGPNDTATASFQLCISNQEFLDQQLASVARFVFELGAGAIALPDQSLRHHENSDAPIEGPAHEV